MRDERVSDQPRAERQMGATRKAMCVSRSVIDGRNLLVEQLSRNGGRPLKISMSMIQSAARVEITSFEVKLT